MFNISFSELLIILLVAFLVLGPKDLAKVGRSLGKAVKKGQQFIYDVKSYVNSDGDSPVKDVQDTVNAVKSTVDSVKEDVAKVNPLAEVKEELTKEIEPVKDLEKDLNSIKKVSKVKRVLKK